MDDYLLWTPIILILFAIGCVFLSKWEFETNDNTDGWVFAFCCVGFLAIAGISFWENGHGVPIQIGKTFFNRLVVGETYSVIQRTEHGGKTYYELAGSNPEDGVRFYTSTQPIPKKFVVQKGPA